MRMHIKFQILLINDMKNEITIATYCNQFQTKIQVKNTVLAYILY